MNELMNICYELLAKYACEKAWVSECFCRDDKESKARAEADQKEIAEYRMRIENAVFIAEDEYIGLTD